MSIPVGEEGLTPSHSPIYALFALAAARYPDKTALIVGTRRLTYREIATRVNHLAAGLAAQGLDAGSHLGVVLPNGIEFVLLMLAAARLGLVLVPQPMGSTGEALAKAFQATDVRHVALWHGLLPRLVDSTALASIAGTRICAGGGASPAGWIAFESLLLPPQPLQTQREPSVAAASHPYLMVLTSGSTGSPKPILLSQETKVARARAAIDLYGLHAGDCILTATPLYHSLAQRLVLIPLLIGATSVVLEHFSPTAWCAAIAEYRCSFSIAVSSQLKQLLPDLHANRQTLTSLRCLVSSSALLDTPTKSSLLEALSCEFHECYGASEIATATNLHAQMDSTKFGSVGKPVPGADLLILDEQGRTASAGNPGEILCRTPLAFSGYYAQPEKTQAAHLNGYFRTGDIGKIDAEGYLYYLGRLKDLVITGGINIYPKDIEDLLTGRLGIEECTVIAVPDSRLGEVVGAVLATGVGRQAPDLRAVQRLCAKCLNDAQQPRHYFIVDQLPRNAMGKVDKPALRRRFATSEGSAA
ncbi:class I adenylate-forming enzyme family protein [Ramlibacter sp. H39-3-26]|uniref:class I adenylate-forming enzyme family protein n=1 Tax=Curvibacter soli TaxID=3031331 RepID=UPI0023DA67B3|nr:class I adenylate-forming enzyme family protein [Ramlibacter sp. H39-3-26]MDF1485781.1 class I adenylate-forming enzyme family protein [Ramlibacter sp. H39-3-26]